MNSSEDILLRRIRWLTGFFIFGLVVSGATAIPLQSELDCLLSWLGPTGPNPSALHLCIQKLQLALDDLGTRYPFVAYGTDWLAFGHFMIALVFVGALRDPVRNRWLYDFGLIACALVIPYAFIFGAVRGIPLWWRFIDCSFGILGALPLWLCRKYVNTITSYAVSA